MPASDARDNLGLSDVASPRYERRRPETTVLYRIVQSHLEAFLDRARRHDGKGLPRYVENELRAFLKCGILSEGFVHARCKSCGHELVVAFSCKRRGACPSCNRLVALIPPPRTPLIHFHGVFAPRFRRRKSVVPKDPVVRQANDCDEPEQQSTDATPRVPARTPKEAPKAAPPSIVCSQTGRSNSGAMIFVERSPKSGPWRIDWATLLFRVYDVDALACPCGGRLHFIELVTDTSAARVILGRLGLRSEPPEPMPATSSSDPDDLPPPDW